MGLSYMSFGGRPKLLLQLGSSFEVRLAVSMGIGIILEDPKVDQANLSDSLGMTLGFSAEAAWYFSHSLGLIVTMGALGQPVGSLEHEGKNIDVEMDFMFFVGMGIEFGS
jgi:hypothetical protein